MPSKPATTPSKPASKPKATPKATPSKPKATPSKPASKPKAKASAAAVRLRELMNADDRAAKDLAKRAGMSAAQWSQLRAGGRAVPSLDTASRILDALGKSFADLAPPVKPTVKAAGFPPACKARARR